MILLATGTVWREKNHVGVCVVVSTDGKVLGHKSALFTPPTGYFNMVMMGMMVVWMTIPCTSILPSILPTS